MDLKPAVADSQSFEELSSSVAVGEELIATTDWVTALQILEHHLVTEGSVSATILKRELERKGVLNPEVITRKLKFNNFESDWDMRLAIPGFKYVLTGRTFFSVQAAEARQKAAEKEAEKAVELAPIQPPEPEPTRRPNRQEEARMVTYVKSALEDLYDTDFRTPEAPFVFDVHNERGGSDLENVDLLAFHWRSESIVDTVTVEVKLEFSARLVQQANNYRRFSNRVWIAFPCESQANEAGLELRDMDPMLFDHVIECGLGILGCRKSRGRSYDVFAVQWPRANQGDRLATELFLERYRAVFEDAHVVERRIPRRFPKIR